ncbi:hypothetical protein B7R76_05580 [Mageeibacillus indolicus]|uniref:Ion-translocating oxidoreductase complex subunit E n=1 Tax=Mageeibacillus indolicus TaxID=884684 RepID=A0A2J8B0M0_9FIRM|nr:hypothetical protein B7R76_05580 [Mageeibacillus indolicus]
MSEGKISLKAEFTKGIIRENPVLRLVLGTCPTLATTTSVESAFGMGMAAAIVLVCSNTVISALRKLIPDKVRIPAYIVIIATFVSIVQMLVKAYVPAIDKQLGIYLPLIVVNCIILGRAEAFAGKHGVLASAIDGLGMGIGFTCALLCMGLFREILGAGSVLGHSILVGGIEPIAVLGLAPGGFFAFGILMALANHLAEKKGKPKASLDCYSCPLSTICSATGGKGVETLAPKPAKPVRPAAAKPIGAAAAPAAAKPAAPAATEAVTAAQTTRPTNETVTSAATPAPTVSREAKAPESASAPATPVKSEEKEAK